ncbi:2-hydroxychromene-2-carboxylate isomerase [Polyangium aurulentum]|uniref:2-hydroxychromene-2-carboxylate isomerase n=1 Tax=Polyangium aurulentum TaxID=2567896 RepID=UPI00146A0B2B|nr:2-hydroxychromene-2-carboxylate isomerase [Polyangium aurulentum]UQA61728.1 2-hydroxychromene-2-carboxylate isomerase [Polyangium aurulentum]
MKRVDFHYDFVCPYAYLAHVQIEAVCARAGAQLAWKPFLLGGVFRAVGAPDAPVMSPQKARLNALDMMRWADHLGVPLRMPEGHPRRTVLALRAAIASGDLVRASKALFSAYWAEGRDVSQPEVVREALDGAGLEGEAIVRRAEDADVKSELFRLTDEAVAAGVFGAPAFVVHAPGVEGELFWGQDRLVLVEEALAGRLGSVGLT